MSMPARRPESSEQQSLSLWSAGEQPTDSMPATAADQPAAGAQLTPAPAAPADLPVPVAGDRAAEAPVAAEPQADLPAAATDPAPVAVLSAPPRPVAVPPRPGRGGLRLGLGGRAKASFGGGDTRNGNGSSAAGR
jgi:hypothetical protein